MTTFIKRLTHTVMADLHALMDKKEEKNPVATLQHAFRLAEKETRKVAELVERQYRLVDEWELKLDHAAQMKKKREDQLVLAKHHEELALVEFAEKEVAHYTRLISETTEYVAKAKEEAVRLEMHHTEMKNKVEEMRIRQLKVIQQENVVRASERMEQVVNSRNYEGTLEASVHSVEKYMDRLEARLARKKHDGDMDARFAELERETSAK